MSHQGLVHALAYSVCGTALASGGDDCSVKIWDVRGAAANTGVPAYAKANVVGGSRSVNMSSLSALRSSERPGLREAVKKFKTKRTIVLNLQFSKRNLLMGAGKFAVNV